MQSVPQLPPSVVLVWAAGVGQPRVPRLTALPSPLVQHSLPHTALPQSAVGLHLRHGPWSHHGRHRGTKRFPAFLTCSLGRKYSGGKDKNNKRASEVFSSHHFSALNWCA